MVVTSTAPELPEFVESPEVAVGEAVALPVEPVAPVLPELPPVAAAPLAPEPDPLGSSSAASIDAASLPEDPDPNRDAENTVVLPPEPLTPEAPESPLVAVPVESAVPVSPELTAPVVAVVST